MNSIRIVMYGDSGTGKSVRASTAAAFGPMEFHDFDEQGSNLQRYLAATDPKRLENIRFISYTGLTSKARIDKFVARRRELQALAVAKKPMPIATLVIDSYTTFEQLYIEYFTPLYTPANTGFGQARQEFEVCGESIIIPGSTDYTVLFSCMKKEFDAWKTIGINIILNCHEKDPVESKKGTKQGTVRAAGAVRDMMPTEFNEFHRLFIDSAGQHRVQAKPTATYLAKTALTGIPSNGILTDNSLKIFEQFAFRTIAPLAANDVK